MGFRKKRRDREYLPAAIQEENYHKNLTDAVKNYVSVLGMGFNVFSGINNIVMGAQQMFISSTGGRLFSINDLRIANGRYFAGLCGHFSQLGANVKDNKLDMLVREYDCLDDFYDGITTMLSFLDWIRNHSSKIGNSQRCYFYYFFRKFLDKDNKETYKKAGAAATEAKKSYERDF